MVHVTRKKAEQLLHKEMLYPRELAQLLGTSEQYLFNEVWRGNLNAVRIGNDVVWFKRSEVLAWLAQREQIAT